jgi:hypothetical protein
MIITCIIGGIGNQMFQYAAAKALAERRQTVLKLDVAHFKHYRPRTYSLGCFRLHAPFASQWEIARLNWPATTGWFYRLYRVRQRIGGYSPPAAFTEKGSYDMRIWDTPQEVYLNGYFQSERYFSDYCDLIRQEFTFRTEPDASNQSLITQISQSQAVSLHVRRGDYVHDAKIRQLHGDVCDLGYYQRCITHLAERIANPHFYIFSDEPDWVTANLNLAHPATFVTHNDPAHAQEDLRLMSLCQHHIIANSSFSWWGAWLNPNPTKLVYAPARWFNDPNKDSQDIIPETWIKV